MDARIRKILTVCSISFLAFACGPFDWSSKNGVDRESIAEIKRRIWEQRPLDRARSLKTVVDFEIKDHIPMGRPASFLISQDGSVYIDDNIYGKLYKVSPDFRSIKELVTNTLTSPTRIREFENNLFVYDNTGINIIGMEGQFIKTVKPYLRIEDFDLKNQEAFVVSLAEVKLDVDPNYVAVLNSTGGRIDSFGRGHPSDFADIENRSFLEVKNDKVFVCYKFVPSLEIYDLGNRNFQKSFDINASIFPQLTELKKDIRFANPEPGRFRIPKFIAGFKVFQDKIYVLLHTPNPEIVEFTLEGKEVQRYTANETPAMEYFGFDIRLDNDAKQFFVGAIDYSGNPSIVVYEE